MYKNCQQAQSVGTFEEIISRLHTHCKYKVTDKLWSYKVRQHHKAAVEFNKKEVNNYIGHAVMFCWSLNWT